MGNCLVTKLKGVVNNDSLIKLNEVRAKVVPSDAGYSMMFLAVKANVILTVNNGGYFAHTDTGLDNPIQEIESQHLTSITLVPNTLNYLYFKSGSYDISVDSKYDILRYQTNYTSPIVFGDFSKIKYLLDVTQVFSGSKEDYGTFEDFSLMKNLDKLTIRTPNITGNFGVLCNTNIHYFEASAQEDIQASFNADSIASAFSSAGRTESDIWFTKCTHKFTIGIVSVLEHYDITCLHWSANKIILYTGCTNYSNPNTAVKIYAKGATAEEIAAWRQAGKTVVVV